MRSCPNLRSDERSGVALLLPLRRVYRLAMHVSSRVSVLLFAGLKERARTHRVELTLELPCTVTQLAAALAEAHPELADQLRHCRFAIDQEFVGNEYLLTHPAEVAAVPPVSGGHDGRIMTVHLGAEPLSLDAVVSAVKHPGAGGIVTFTGCVRSHSRGREVRHLEYEAYGPMALRVMSHIVTEVERAHEGARVAIHHRTGRLDISDIAVIIAVAAPHRAEAFAACRQVIEWLKRDVPIWKKEFSPDGSIWIGQGP